MKLLILGAAVALALLALEGLGLSHPRRLGPPSILEQKAMGASMVRAG